MELEGENICSIFDYGGGRFKERDWSRDGVGVEGKGKEVGERRDKGWSRVFERREGLEEFLFLL